MSETNGHTATRLGKAQRRLYDPNYRRNTEGRLLNWSEWLVSPERCRYWLERMGLLPPEFRGFVPAREGDEKPPCLDKEYEQWRKKMEKKAEELRGVLADPEQWPYPLQPTWSLPIRGENDSPSWHNVVRAYEEDR